jgi:hypothetical protein
VRSGDDFRELLAGLGLDGDQIVARERGVAALEARLTALADPVTVEACTADHVAVWVASVIDDGANDWGTPVGVRLEDRGRRRIEELEQHRDAGTPYFDQRIDDAVIDFVRATPEIDRGVRHGTTVVETKFPHQAIAHLAATDPTIEQYHACHCPVVKESMAHDDVEISGCRLSGGRRHTRRLLSYSTVGT